MRIIYLILMLVSMSTFSQNIVIGDSQTPYIDKNSNKVEKVQSLWKAGIGVKKLTLMVLNYKTSPEVENIIICIGTNDAFQTGNIKQLFQAVKTTFSNATIYVIKGSWGWGNNKRITQQKVNKYYKQYEQQGAIIINPAIGKHEPHKDLPVYKTIAKKLDSILK